MEVIIANPRQVELISKSNRKTDVNDAALLARMAVTPELLAPIVHRSQQAQAHLQCCARVMWSCACARA